MECRKCRFILLIHVDLNHLYLRQRDNKAVAVVSSFNDLSYEFI